MTSPFLCTTAKWNIATDTVHGELANLKKSIYSIKGLREIMLGCNRRYLAFLDSLDDTSAVQRDLLRLSQSRVSVDSEQTVKWLNFFDPTAQRLLKVL